MNVPNALSIFRIGLIPVFALVFFNGGKNAHLYAMAVFMLAGLTDIIDGKIARKYNQITTLGKILDPLADKLMVFTALLCCTISEVIPTWATILYFTKEILQGIMGFILFRKVKDVPPSNVLGKGGTVSFYFTIALCLLFPIPGAVKNILLAVCFTIIIIALVSYIINGFNMKNKQKDA